MIYKKSWKYILIKEDSYWCITKKFYRLKALKNFSDVSKDELGGYIQHSYNLSQKGNCWVYYNAWVSGDAHVTGNAQVFGSACVIDNAKVYGESQIYGHAVIKDNAIVEGNARVYGTAVVHSNAIIIHGDFN